MKDQTHQNPKAQNCRNITLIQTHNIPDDFCKSNLKCLFFGPGAKNQVSKCLIKHNLLKMKF